MLFRLRKQQAVKFRARASERWPPNNAEDDEAGEDEHDHAHSDIDFCRVMQPARIRSQAASRLTNDEPDADADQDRDLQQQRRVDHEARVALQQQNPAVSRQATSSASSVDLTDRMPIMMAESRLMAMAAGYCEINWFRPWPATVAPPVICEATHVTRV